MALNPLIDSRDVHFTLFEMFEAEQLLQIPEFSHLDRDTFESTIDLAEKIAVNHFYPSNNEGDKEGGCTYDPVTKSVTVPESVKKACRAYIDAGFLLLRAGTDRGGMGMPATIASACSEYFDAGNTAANMYMGLALGSAHIISLYGSEEQIKTYCTRMINGEWGGTMCLTEPDAGSDVGNLKTKAVKQPDGTYRISGQKIFISAGEHDMVDNIIHTVLARVEGDPAGTKGISIFIVPKYLVNPDGTLGKKNDVVCTGIEHKMGLKNSATASLSFGDDGECVGYLLGEERQGMAIMFNLMNNARIGTGIQAQGQATAAYMHAVTYAKGRIQSPHITQSMNPDAPMVPIIEHPDVKRMLLWMKSYVEGMRMMIYYNALCLDMSRHGKDDDKKNATAVVELLTPLVKAGISDVSWLVTAEAIQTYGGYGFCSDYPVEQYARDTKIFSIYEGTNGIQSLDLTFRKILMNPEQFNYKTWRIKTDETIAAAKGIVDDKYINKVEQGLKKLDEAIAHLLGYTSSGKFMLISIEATPLQKAMFMVVLAWLHLWSLTVSSPKLKELTGDAKGPERQKIIDENKEAAYYNGRVLSSQFFIGSEFTRYFGMIDAILEGETAVAKASASVFTGALEP